MSQVMAREKVQEAFKTSLRYARDPQGIPPRLADSCRLEADSIAVGLDAGLNHLNYLRGELLTVLAQRPLDALPVVFSRVRSADLVRERQADHAEWVRRISGIVEEVDCVRLVLADYAAGLEAQRLTQIEECKKLQADLRRQAAELNAARIENLRLQDGD